MAPAFAEAPPLRQESLRAVSTFLDSELQEFEGGIDDLFTWHGDAFPRVVSIAARLGVPVDRIVVQPKAFEVDNYASNGKYVVLSMALVTEAPESALAFVIGHEWGHVQHRDTWLSLALAHQVGLAACGQPCPKTDFELMGAGLADEAQLPPAHFWAREFGADREALARLKKAGYDYPLEDIFAGMLGPLDTEKVRQESSRTHPSIAARIRNLREYTPAN